MVIFRYIISGLVMVRFTAKVTVRVNGYEQEFTSTVLDFSRRGEDLVNWGSFTSVVPDLFTCIVFIYLFVHIYLCIYSHVLYLFMYLFTCIVSFIKEIDDWKYPED